MPNIPFGLGNGTPLLNAGQSGATSLMDALRSGIETYQKNEEAKNTPKRLSEALLGQQITNKMNQQKIDYEPMRQQLARQLTQARIKRALREPQLTGDAATLEYLIKNKDRLSQLVGGNQPQQESDQSFIPSIAGGPQMPPTQSSNSPDYGQQLLQHTLNKLSGIKEPTQYAPSNTGKELQERADVEAGFYPNTGRSQRFETPEQQQEFANIYSSKTTGLPKGQHYILGDNGERVGIERPKSAKERDIDRGTVLFNFFYPKINEGLNYYSGEKSIRNLENDAKNYKTDPKSKKRFDDLLVAIKLSTVTGVNEAARFGAGRTNQTFNRFYNTLSSYDIPSKIDKLIKQYQIPASANIKAGYNFQELLNKADEKYKQSATPTTKEYFTGKAPHKEKESEAVDYVRDASGRLIPAK